VEDRSQKERQKNGSFSLICQDVLVMLQMVVCGLLTERVILSAGAMLIFSVSFQIDQMPEGEVKQNNIKYIVLHKMVALRCHAYRACMLQSTWQVLIQ
jgi:hypothetical protein